MTPTLYRDTGYSLTHLIEDIKHGNIALPDIQRPFVWKASQVRDLFDSLYRGYPVGTLLFWETGTDTGVRQVGGGENEKVAKLLIVDGQQRLTSLYAVLTGRPILTKSFDKKHIRIAFCPGDQVFEVTDAAIERDPEFIPDINALWNDGYRPTVRKFFTRLIEGRSVELDEAEKDELEDRIDRVRDLQNFRFQVIELNTDADEEQVAEIFVRTNSKAVQLNQADFILTLMSVHWEKGRRQLEAFCRDAVTATMNGPSPRNPFIDPAPDQLLRVGVGLAFRRGRLRHVYNILRGKDFETGSVSSERRNAQFDALRRAQDEVIDLTNWHEFLKCLTHAGFRSSRMITSKNAILFSYILWLIGRRDFGLDLQILRGVVGRWFFMAHVTGRYTGSFESQFEADFGRINMLEHGDGKGFCHELDRIIRSTFTGDYWDITLPNRLDTAAPKSPPLCAYWAALILLDAELLFSDLRVRDLLDPQVTPPRSIERHHLFPKAYLAANGFATVREQNAIGNMAFVDWPDNVKIGKDGPLEYWPVLAGGFDRERLKQQVYWHALPIGWEQLDYPTFLERRRHHIAKVVRDGFEYLWENESVGRLPSTLRDLLSIGESQRVEFKSTARWNVRAGRADKKMEHVVVKTVCGYLNAEGGKLLIGVDDDGRVLGLDDDLKTLSKGTIDAYELFLRQRLDTGLSVPTAEIVQIGFERVKEAIVCVVTVAASGKPVFSKPHGGGSKHSEFWVRVGNATKQLHGEDMVDYMSNHWG